MSPTWRTDDAFHPRGALPEPEQVPRMFVALLVAAGVTALVAVGMMLASLKRSRRLTVPRGLASAALGVGIVAASDYAMATDRAALRLSELAVGIGPFVVGPAIERKVGAGAFSAMAFDADWRDAAWGAVNGLYARVWDTVPALDAGIDVFVATLAKSNPEAVARIKTILEDFCSHDGNSLIPYLLVNASKCFEFESGYSTTARTSSSRRINRSVDRNMAALSWVVPDNSLGSEGHAPAPALGQMRPWAASLYIW